MREPTIRYSCYNFKTVSKFCSSNAKITRIDDDRRLIDSEESLNEEVDEILKNMGYKISMGNGTEETEGTFKANELDVVYVTAPGGYKFRFEFNFEWELIAIPGNGSIPVSVSDGYPIPGSYPSYPATPLFDQFGVPLKYDAKCDISQFQSPAEHIFNAQLSAAADSEYATKVIMQNFFRLFNLKI